MMAKCSRKGGRKHDEFYKTLPAGGKYPKTLLDIGCGSCPEGEQILSSGIDLTGVDQDGETIRKVRRRLPQGAFAAADAAFWLDKQERHYEAVLIRRPDVIFRSENWHQVFRRLPKVLGDNGRVVVTTPGESEAGLCEKWLRETADTVRRSAAGNAEEAWIVTAADLRKTEEEENSRGSFIQSLSWEEDRPRMVCDLRTGRCTTASDGGGSAPEEKEA